MGRLIDLDAAIDAIFSEPLYNSGMKKRDVDVVVPVIYEKIKSLPSAQPEIIHCRDCKHGDWYTVMDGKRYCHCVEHGSYGNDADDFCSRAERQEDGKTD